MREGKKRKDGQSKTAGSGHAESGSGHAKTKKGRGQEGKRRDKRTETACSWFLSLGRAVVSANQIHHSYSEDLISTFYHVTFHHHHSFSI